MKDRKLLLYKRCQQAEEPYGELIGQGTYTDW